MSKGEVVSVPAPLADAVLAAAVTLQREDGRIYIGELRDSVGAGDRFDEALEKLIDDGKFVAYPLEDPVELARRGGNKGAWFVPGMTPPDILPCHILYFVAPGAQAEVS